MEEKLEKMAELIVDMIGLAESEIDDSAKKDEIKEGIEKILEKGYSGVVFATNKGQCVVGNKYSIINILLHVLGEMYEKDQLSDNDLEAMFETVKQSKNKDEQKEEVKESKVEKSIEKMLNEIFK